MIKITGISILLIALATSCTSIRQYRYMTKAKAPKGTFRTEIPFELSNGLIVIDVKLNDSDKEFKFMVDTGAPVSVIYQEALDASKAEPVMSYKVSDSQGNTAKSNYFLLDVGIGDLVFKDVFAAYSKPHEILPCIAPGGIIGADLMQTANWQIDFENKKIILSDFKSGLPTLADYQKMSFSKRAPFSALPWLAVIPGMTVDVEVNGERVKDVLVDSGASGSLTLAERDRSDTLFKNTPKEVLTGYASFGLLGAQRDTTFYCSSSNVYLDDLHLDNQTIELTGQYQSLLGMEILSDYTVLIDFRKKNIYLKPAASVQQEDPDKPEFGFAMYYDTRSGTCLVANIYEGSSAAVAGLLLTDTIVAINQQEVPVFTDFCAFREWSKNMRSEDLLLVKTARKEEVLRIGKAAIPKK